MYFRIRMLCTHVDQTTFRGCCPEGHIIIICSSTYTQLSHSCSLVQTGGGQILSNYAKSPMTAKSSHAFQRANQQLHCGTHPTGITAQDRTWMAVCLGSMPHEPERIPHNTKPTRIQTIYVTISTSENPSEWSLLSIHSLKKALGHFSNKTRHTLPPSLSEDI